ncbi:3-[(3aS,4S,7aS)-7a-methyl-1,5-dioxo-octahydro-1H-inden-4-yl]propanoyl:CoA ligase-like [Haemaphysalis longicornis]
MSKVKRSAMKPKIENGIVQSPYPDCASKECKSILTVLKEMVDKYGPKIAMTHKEDQLTYPELLTRIQTCAAGFLSEGIGAGDRVYVHVDNGIESFSAICGMLVVGATFVTSAVWLDADEIHRRMKEACATHVVTEEKYAHLFSWIKEHHPLTGAFTVRERIPGFKCVRDFYLTARVQDIREGACTFVDWSSGTTGLSKWSERPEKYFLQQIMCSEAAQVLSADDTFLGSLNISSCLGFALYFLALYVGAPVTIVESFSAVQEIYEAAKNLQVTAIFGSPWKLRCLLDEIGNSAFILDALRKSTTKILLTGCPAQQEVVHELTETFRLKELRCIYGMTDVGAFLTVPPSGEICGTGVGFPAPLSKMKRSLYWTCGVGLPSSYAAVYLSRHIPQLPDNSSSFL